MIRSKKKFFDHLFRDGITPVELSSIRVILDSKPESFSRVINRNIVDIETLRRHSGSRADWPPIRYLVPYRAYLHREVINANHK